MQRISKIKLLKKLKEIDKPYFTINDLWKILNLSKQSVYVTCSRLVKSGDLYRLRKNIYTLDNSPQNIQKIANLIYWPSYLSFESALAFYGILNQIPYTSIFATKLKSKKIDLGGQLIEYRQILPKLFFGYTLQKDLFVALPEKAILDQLYLVSLGKARIDRDELNLKEVSKTKFLEFSKKFPPRTQKLAQKFLIQFGKTSITIK